MRKLLFLLLLAPFYLAAQNLVPNPTFSIHSNCPYNFNQVRYATGWYMCRENNNNGVDATDYCNVCGGSTSWASFSIPTNCWGYQPADSGAYMAQASTGLDNPLPDYRENIFCQLVHPLIVGHTYCLALKVNKSDITQTATDKIGIKLATDSNLFSVNNYSQLYSNTVISDTVAWTTISGTFVADSAYTYVGVGNFFDNAHTNIVTVCSSCAREESIYLIEYVYVGDMGYNSSTISDCGGGQVQLNAGGNNLNSYAWSPAAGLSCINCPSPFASPTISTTYTTIVSSPAGCAVNDSVKVNYGQANNVSGVVGSSNDTICPGTPAYLTVTGNSGGIQWQSSTDSLSGYSNITGTSSAGYTSRPLDNTTYFRVIAGTGVCADTSLPFKIVVIPPPVSFYSASADGQEVTFSVYGSSGVVSYYWDFGDGTTSNLQNPTHTYDSVGIFDVCLTVKNTSNCNFTICENVTTYPTGINEITGENSFLIYPDPFSTELYISRGKNSDAIEKIELFDLLGRKIYSEENLTINPIELDMSKLVSGTYFIRIMMQQGDFVKTIIKE